MFAIQASQYASTMFCIHVSAPYSYFGPCYLFNEDKGLILRQLNSPPLAGLKNHLYPLPVHIFQRITEPFACPAKTLVLLLCQNCSCSSRHGAISVSSVNHIKCTALQEDPSLCLRLRAPPLTFLFLNPTGPPDDDEADPSDVMVFVPNSASSFGCLCSTCG